MDSTKRPIKISPQLVNYAEKHKIFELMKELLELLIIDRPDNPLRYLIDYLNKDIGQVARIFLIGPPASGKYTIGKMLSGRLQSVLLTRQEVFKESDPELKSCAEDCINRNQPIPPDVWMKALLIRTKSYDCEKRGYVLIGFPETREQAYAVQCVGIYPTHFIELVAPDHMLIERADGKRIDPETGDIYHCSFDPAPDVEIRDRLIKPPGGGYSREEMQRRLVTYHRNAALVSAIYSQPRVNSQKINADQPIADVFQTALDFAVKTARLPALRTPRIILIGPPGSGKSTLAQLLCKKYGIMHVHCADIIRTAIADENKHGLAMRSYVDKNLPVPDSILIQLIEEKLTDLCCSTYGWLLYGYPRTSKQAEELDCVKLEPNRVFFLDVPPFVCLERLCERRLDPVTGEKYHLSYNPPTGPTNITQRLVTHPRDDVKVVKQRLAAFNSQLAELKEYYPKHITIDANQDIYNVFELIESYIVNPLPLDLDFDCQSFEVK